MLLPPGEFRFSNLVFFTQIHLRGPVGVEDLLLITTVMSQGLLTVRTDWPIKSAFAGRHALPQPKRGGLCSGTTRDTLVSANRFKVGVCIVLRDVDFAFVHLPLPVGPVSERHRAPRESIGQLEIPVSSTGQGKTDPFGFGPALFGAVREDKAQVIAVPANIALEIKRQNSPHLRYSPS